MARLDTLLSGSLAFRDNGVELVNLAPHGQELQLTGSLHVKGPTLKLAGSDLGQRLTTVEAAVGDAPLTLGGLTIWSASINYFTQSIADATGSYATTASNSFTGSQFFSGSLIPEALDSENGIHDLGSQSKPWRDLYLTTGSLKFIKDGEIFSTVSGEREGIRVGNILITTSSLQVINDAGDIIDNIYQAQISSSGELEEVVEQSLPAGIVSSSAQIANLHFLSSSIQGIISRSAQISDLGFITASRFSEILELPELVSGSVDATRLLSGSITGSVHMSSSIFTIQSSSVERLRLKSDGTLNIFTDVTGSTAIYSNNVNAGYPTSNRWQQNLEGSYFNNFDHDTNVSEILRFMAGVLSSSLDVADAKPNTRTWSGVSTSQQNLGGTTGASSLNGGRLSQHWTGSSRVNNTFKAHVSYTVDKGFTTAGSFNNGTGQEPYEAVSNPYYYNFANWTFNNTATLGGSSTIGNAGNFGMGRLTSGGPTAFTVRVLASQSFSDNTSNTAPSATNNTFTTASYVDYTISSFGTSNGLTLSKINTSQPAVIPAAYQDGDFNSIAAPFTGHFYEDGSNSSTSISASGYYRIHDIKVGLKSGSQSDFVYKNSSSTFSHLWMPINTLDDDNPTPGTLSATDKQLRSLTLAPSRSLSGAPYLTAGSSTWELSMKVSNVFDPAFRTSTVFSQVANESIAGSVSSPTTVVCNTSGVNSANKIYSNDGSTVRTVGSLPHYNDIILVTGSITHTIGSTDENINQTGLGTGTWSQQSYAYEFDGSAVNVDTRNIGYHTAGTYGQPSSSGSLGIYGRAQGYDGGSLTGTTEYFSGEDHRIQLNNNVTTFSGDAFTTTFSLTKLGAKDLQVKPGFLVDPGGTYRYWYHSGFNSGTTYKYYIRRFQTSGTKTSMTVNVSKTLVNWNATTDGVSVAVLFKSSGNGSGTNNSLSRARIYDISDLLSNVISTNVSNDDHINPFTSAIDLYGNTGGSLSGTTYTVPLRNADGMYLDSSDNEFYVIVRYKGDPSPVTSIITATS